MAALNSKCAVYTRCDTVCFFLKIMKCLRQIGAPETGVLSKLEY